MFAFCPSINQRVCGVSSSTDIDMRLEAGLEKEIVYSKQMRYITKGTRENPVNMDRRSYDACYYEVFMSNKISQNTKKNLTKNANGGQVKIYLELTTAKNIDVYMYIGKSRESAY